MTVAELIQELEKVEDKSLPVLIDYVEAEHECDFVFKQDKRVILLHNGSEL